MGLKMTILFNQNTKAESMRTALFNEPGDLRSWRLLPIIALPVVSNMNCVMHHRRSAL